MPKSNVKDRIRTLEENYIEMVNLDVQIVQKDDVRDFLASERESCKSDQEWIQRLQQLSAQETRIKMTPSSGFEDGRWLAHQQDKVDQRELEDEFGVHIPRHGRDLDDVRSDR